MASSVTMAAPRHLGSTMRNNRQRRRQRHLSRLPWLLCLAIVTLLLCSTSIMADDEEASPEASLWEPVDEITVLGPTVFPKPNHLLGRDAVVTLKPEFGTHRPSVDAVFCYAEGYSLPYYLAFIETLRDTGFDGDVVVCIASRSILKPNVQDYLSNQPNVVVYLANLSCYEPDQVTPSSRRVDRGGSLDIFQMCKLDHAYGIPDKDGTVKSVPDARIGRTVATLRYELYWMWCLHYNPNSWILLLDARDSYFQTNPFSNVPRNNEDVSSGRLWFFGENTEATRLGLSKKNRNWLKNAYGEPVLNALKDKPTICSGSTMGEQVALETYLRAMVNEWDETGLKMTGADQGFHNYLYYSRKLQNAKTIAMMELWEQGKGAVNNVGAMRTKPLSEWKMYNETTHEVYNWDGSLSPVVHQYDRDKHLFHYTVRDRFNQLEQAWKAKNQKL